MSPARLHHRSRGGFTLIEVLLALGLLAALLLAMNQFVFAITEAWVKEQDRFVFVQHTRAVTRHLDNLLQTAAVRAHASEATTGAPAVAEVELPDGAGKAALLTFDLPEGDRLFTWPAAPLPEVRCALGWVRDEGLVLYWKSHLEKDFETADPRRVVLSPFVTGISYDYYDAESGTWTEEDGEPQADQAGEYAHPSRLRLHFARGGETIEEVVVLPPAKEEGLPVY